MIPIKLSERQEKIIDIVRLKEPITSEDIGKELSITRATLRPDLTILTMLEILEAKPKVGYFFKGQPIETFFFDKILDVEVRDIKGVPIVVKEDTTAYDATVTMLLENIGTVYVVGDESVLLGIVSRKDLLKNALGRNDLSKLPVGVIMTRMPNIITIDEKDTILDAAIKMIDYDIESVPIIKEKNGIKNVLIGKISKTTIVKAFVEIYKDR